MATSLADQVHAGNWRAARLIGTARNARSLQVILAAYAGYSLIILGLLRMRAPYERICGSRSFTTEHSTRSRACASSSRICCAFRSSSRRPLGGVSGRSRHRWKRNSV